MRLFRAQKYESDPLGRLAGTTRWLTVTTFAATEVIEREAARVNAMHDHVKGEFKISRAIIKELAEDFAG